LLKINILIENGFSSKMKKLRNKLQNLIYMEKEILA